MGRHISEEQFNMTKELMATVPIKIGESRKAYFDRLKKINQRIPCKDKLYKIFEVADYAEYSGEDPAPAAKTQHDLAAAYRFLRDECIEVELNDMKHLIITVEVSKWESLF